MIELLRPKNEIELAMVRGILDGDGIPYIVRNDHFGSLLGGPIRYDYNEKAVMVEEEHAERARELLVHIMEDPGEL
jgi:ligand-binding sensor protein